MSDTGAAAAARNPSRTVTAGLLAWVFPGLGHLYLRRRGKGLLLMGSILALFVMGVAMKSRLALHLGLEDPLALLFSVAQMGAGAPYVAARLLGYEAGEVTSASYEYGNTFTAVAGLLNILVILDALDTARGHKDKKGGVKAVLGSHLATLVVFSALVSTVFALLLRDGTSERVRFGLTAFAAFVLSTLVIGWLTNPFPR